MNVSFKTQCQMKQRAYADRKEITCYCKEEIKAAKYETAPKKYITAGSSLDLSTVDFSRFAIDKSMH